MHGLMRSFCSGKLSCQHSTDQPLVHCLWSTVLGSGTVAHDVPATCSSKHKALKVPDKRKYQTASSKSATELTCVLARPRYSSLSITNGYSDRTRPLTQNSSKPTDHCTIKPKHHRDRLYMVGLAGTLACALVQ